jgi:hypothetical protein
MGNPQQIDKSDVLLTRKLDGKKEGEERQGKVSTQEVGVLKVHASSRYPNPHVWSNFALHAGHCYGVHLGHHQCHGPVCVYSHATVALCHTFLVLSRRVNPLSLFLSTLSAVDPRPRSRIGPPFLLFPVLSFGRC